MLPNRLYIAASLMSALLLGSCSEDENITQNNTIRFRVIKPEQMGTRAEVTEVGDVSPGFWLHVSNDDGDYINEFALYDWNTGEVTLSKDYTWPDGELTFAAYCDGQSMMLTSPEGPDGGIHLDTRNGDSDYVVAYTKLLGDTVKEGVVNLEFKHILAYAEIYYKAAAHAADDPNYYNTYITACVLAGVAPRGTFYPKSLVDPNTQAWVMDELSSEDNDSNFEYSFLNGERGVWVEPTTEPQHLINTSIDCYNLCVIPGKYMMAVSYEITSTNPNAKPESTRAMTAYDYYNKSGTVTLVGGRRNALIIDLSGNQVSGGNDNDDPSAPDNPEAD